MLCSTLLPYQNALTDPLLRCPIALYPSAFDHPSPPPPATQQASRAHDKRDLYNTCIVSQLSRNKYCLNQRKIREFNSNEITFMGKTQNIMPAKYKAYTVLFSSGHTAYDDHSI